MSRRSLRNCGPYEKLIKNTRYIQQFVRETIYNGKWLETIFPIIDLHEEISLALVLVSATKYRTVSEDTPLQLL